MGHFEVCDSHDFKLTKKLQNGLFQKEEYIWAIFKFVSLLIHVAYLRLYISFTAVLGHFEVHLAYGPSRILGHFETDLIGM